MARNGPSWLLTAGYWLAGCWLLAGLVAGLLAGCWLAASWLGVWLAGWLTRGPVVIWADFHRKTIELLRELKDFHKTSNY